MPKEQDTDIQYRIAMILEELLKWTKVTSIPYVKKLLIEVLQKDEHKIAYHKSDGLLNRDEIGGLINVSGQTISNWWKSWERSGIVEMITAKGGKRGRKSFNLEDFDIQIPKMKVEQENQTTSQEPKKVETNDE